MDDDVLVAAGAELDVGVMPLRASSGRCDQLVQPHELRGLVVACSAAEVAG